MTALVWDRLDERQYENGVDHGVLYLSRLLKIPWNGLISVRESQLNKELTSLRFDGISYLHSRSGGNYQAIVSAYSYPEKFKQHLGLKKARPGIIFTNQELKRFNFSYRTRVNEHDYKIHLIYNAVAVTTRRSVITIGDVLSPNVYEWTLHCVPIDLDGFRSSAHLIIDSTKIDPIILEGIEAILYNVDDDSYEVPEFPEIALMLGF